MSALADRHLGEAFVRLRLRLGQLPPEYLRLPALIHEGLTQQMPDYAAAVRRLEGMLGRDLSETLDEAAFITAYAVIKAASSNVSLRSRPSIPSSRRTAAA